MSRSRLLAVLVAVGSSAAMAMGGLAATGTASQPATHARQVQTGAQVLAADHYAAVAGKKVGIIANPTTVLPDLSHVVDVMAASNEVDLVAVFGPEHGFRGTAQAGGSEGYYTDEKTGLPVYDLYAKTVDARQRS